MWVRSSFHVVDVIPFPQEGSSAAAARDPSAGHVSSGEECANTKPQPEDEVLARLREAAESLRKVAGQAHAQSD